MLESRLVFVAAVAGYASLVGAQVLWQSNQVNTTMCSWEGVRATVVRDTLYLDGGILWWEPGLSTGEYGAVTSDTNPLGIIWTLNFSTPFNVTQNITALMGSVPKGLGGGANNIAPNYIDGALMSNDDEFVLFGGLLVQGSVSSPPVKDQVLEYQKYQYTVDKPAFVAGFKNLDLPDSMTRYIAYGGGVNAPSENKAWYFGGMQTPVGGEIYYGSNATYTASVVTEGFVTLDMTSQNSESYSNTTLPSSVSSRANPQVVWVPVGAQGILVVLGGVDYPEWTTATTKSANAAQSEKDSPGYISNIDIYDIANDKWYQQPTVLGPNQTTRGCAVVAPAQDFSSFNIYYYGGYTGLARNSLISDEVWVLSLPSFMWMRVSSGNPDHGRAGHKCFMPYPDQMIVVGGYTNQTTQCVEGNIVQMFNLTSTQWMDGYDPAKYYDYGVPDKIYPMIGGSKTGGATATSPTPDGWKDPALAEVFKTKYPTSKLTHYYPYAPATPVSSTHPTITPNTGTGSGGLPSWAPIVLGVVLGLVFITCIAVGILFWRRRKYFRRGMSVAGTEETNGHRIMSWMRGHQSEAKAPTVTTEETPTSPDMESVSAQVYHPPPIMEMMDTQISYAELGDTSRPMELHDEALTPQAIVDKHSHIGQNGNGSPLNPSSYSNVSPADQASTISNSTGPNAGNGVVPSSGLHRPAAPTHIQFDTNPSRSDSPAFGSPGMDPAQSQAAVATAVSPTMARHMSSGVSGVSESDRTHLRQISDTTVSSVNSGGAFNAHQAPTSVPAPIPGQLTPGSPSPGESPGSAGPVSPPSAGAVEGFDYISARRTLGPNGGNGASGSPLRRSVFHEHHEDTGEDQNRGDQRGDTV